MFDASPAKSLSGVAVLLYPAFIVRTTVTKSCESYFAVQHCYCEMVRFVTRSRQVAIGTENERQAQGLRG